MILPDGRVESCGNFHGAPIGYVLDFLAIAVADLGALVGATSDNLATNVLLHQIGLDAVRALGDKPLSEILGPCPFLFMGHVR